MKWVLIRHGKTQGNLERRYIGCRTDEALCAQGMAELSQTAYPAVEHVFVSPMKRCIETAMILYPGIPVTIVDHFRECDFGDFENLSHAELNGRTDYQSWIDSNGNMPFPNGESRAAFAERCATAFAKICNQMQDCAVIAHGGTIMAIMEQYAKPKGNYYDYQVKNGEGYILHPDGAYEKLTCQTQNGLSAQMQKEEPNEHTA